MYIYTYIQGKYQDAIAEMTAALEHDTSNTSIHTHTHTDAYIHTYIYTYIHTG
jgi:hypothetical protein